MFGRSYNTIKDPQWYEVNGSEPLVSGRATTMLNWKTNVCQQKKSLTKTT